MLHPQQIYQLLPKFMQSIIMFYSEEDIQEAYPNIPVPDEETEDLPMFDYPGPRKFSSPSSKCHVLRMRTGLRLCCSAVNQLTSPYLISFE